jgi:hypothetical protein
MIIGGFAAGVRIMLEIGPSRHHVSKDQEILEKYHKIIFYQKTEEARRRRREEPQGGLTVTTRKNPLLDFVCCFLFRVVVTSCIISMCILDNKNYFPKIIFYLS